MSETPLPRLIPEDWLTIAQTCKALRISRPTYHRWVKAGHLHPQKFGPQCVILAKAEVETLCLGR